MGDADRTFVLSGPPVELVAGEPEQMELSQGYYESPVRHEDGLRFCLR